ncbi:hypothetical protein L1987_74833 [Smallanthus sonchifolius]|uniref:Uncharacterized protein n=1 Tax=Smallanthus sonchifolius TaxID=185202 RepID=A0ACB9A3Z9_9ASTR|nr:hypothetical protein L1987_74833 [Smallanthus sonchifolius]
MDSYPPPSPVYSPEIESENEEDTGTLSPNHQPPMSPSIRSIFGIRADWMRNTGLRASEPHSSRDPYQAPHRHNLLPTPPRDPYLTPDPYHLNSRIGQTIGTSSAIGVPADATHQYVRTAEFMRQGMKQGIRHDLLSQRIDSLLGQVQYQEDLIANLSTSLDMMKEDREIFDARTEIARAESRFAIRVTITMFILVLVCFLVESYLRR